MPMRLLEDVMTGLTPMISPHSAWRAARSRWLHLSALVRMGSRESPQERAKAASSRSSFWGGRRLSRSRARARRFLQEERYFSSRAAQLRRSLWLARA